MDSMGNMNYIYCIHWEERSFRAQKFSLSPFLLGERSTEMCILAKKKGSGSVHQLWIIHHPCVFVGFLEAKL